MTVFFVKQSMRNVLTNVAVGMGAASFWRGAWYVLDDHLFPDSSRETSAAASFVLGVLGMTASQGLMQKWEAAASQPNSILSLRVARLGALYTVAISCVLVWRGTWLGWDCVYEQWHARNGSSADSDIPKDPQVVRGEVVVKATDRGHATWSGFLSHATAITLLVGTGFFASVMAPPAAVSVIRDWAVRAGTNSARASASTGVGPSKDSVHPGLVAPRIITQHYFLRENSTFPIYKASVAQSASASVRAMSTPAARFILKPYTINRISEKARRTI
jgi:Fuseless